MNYLHSLRMLAVAGLIFAAPAVGLSKDHHHGSGKGHHHSGNWHHDHGHRSYYGGGYGYRAYPYFRPSLSFGFYSAPAYYDTPTYYRDSYVYRGAVCPAYNDDLAVDVQRALARRGFYRGAIDGDVGPGTRAAIRSFQYNRGLTVTGRIDGSLLRSLGLS